MSQQMIEERVGKLETEQARQGERLSRIEADVGKTASGVERLLERDARRPQALSWAQISAGAITALTLGGGIWYLTIAIVEHSPIVVEHERRLTKIDDPADGHVARIKDRLHTLEGWQPKIVGR